MESWSVSFLFWGSGVVWGVGSVSVVICYCSVGGVWVFIFFFLTCFFLNKVLLSAEVKSVASFSAGGVIGIGAVDNGCFRMVLRILGEVSELSQ